MWRPCSPTSLAAETVGLLKDHPLSSSWRQICRTAARGTSQDLARWGWQFNLELWAALWNFFADSDLDRSVASALARLEVRTLTVRLGRDGGGKPSPGRLKPQLTGALGLEPGFRSFSLRGRLL